MGFSIEALRTGSRSERNAGGGFAGGVVVIDETGGAREGQGLDVVSAVHSS